MGWLRSGVHRSRAVVQSPQRFLPADFLLYRDQLCHRLHLAVSVQGWVKQSIMLLHVL